MSWLKAYVDLDCETNDFIEKITLSGSKVETVDRQGRDLSGIVVGKVLSVEKHPNADKLFVCRVDAGSGILQIVTGADNLYAGAFVPVALNNSTVSGGIKIKSGKLRGLDSEGMMCSIGELGFTCHDFPEATEDGIYIFPEEHPIGADVKPIMEIEQDVVEYEITSNRPDCFSILGIAREAAATYNKPFCPPVVTVRETAGGKCSDYISVEIQNPGLCYRYAARVVKNVRLGPSPQWLRRRLTMCGVRPMNNIVDITNYVMLEMGQPMHAFDIDNISERKIIVRNAENGEKFTTLDSVNRVLDSSMLVISDPQKAVAIAGIMGGENSKVTGGASAVLFESATFNGTNIRLSSKKLGLRTDSSGKYEKGIDPNLAVLAVNRAAQLVEELGCGEVVPGIVDCYPNPLAPTREIPFEPARINALLGTDISSGEMAGYLKRLEIEVSGGNCVIPSFRPDLEMTADIAEEVARLYGYDKIEATLASGAGTVGKKTAEQLFIDNLRGFMVSSGFCEDLSYSFESPKVFDKLLIPVDSHLRRTVKILNPLGEDFSIMRTTTLNAILSSLSTNFNHRNEESSLFEISNVYIPKSLPLTELPEERLMLTFGEFNAGDFYDCKGVLENLFAVTGIKAEFSPEKNLPFMHPGRTAKISLENGTEIGFVGEVHPQVLENYEIGVKAYISAISIKPLFKAAKTVKRYIPLPKFPGIRRDISMLVPDDTLVKNLEAAIREKGTKLLEDVKLFDVYKNENMKPGLKSVAYSIFFRADRTLVEEEVSNVMKGIVSNLEEKTGAQLRDK